VRIVEDNRCRNKEQKEQRKEEIVDKKEIKGSNQLYYLHHLHQKKIIIGRDKRNMKIRTRRRKKVNKFLSYLNRQMMRKETTRIMIIKSTLINTIWKAERIKDLKSLNSCEKTCKNRN